MKIRNQKTPIPLFKLAMPYSFVMLLIIMVVQDERL